MANPQLFDPLSTPVRHIESKPTALYKRFLTGPSQSQIEFEKTLTRSHAGSATETGPFLVKFAHDDPVGPMNLSPGQRRTMSAIVAIGALIVSFSSSAYNGGIEDLVEQFGISREVAVAGVSLYVLGFAVGPLLWAPLSEIHGRRGVLV